MTIRIISPQGVIYEGSGGACRIPAVDGGMTILTHHIPTVVGLRVGAVRVAPALSSLDEESDYIAINGGVMQTNGVFCRILASYAIRARDIDEAAALLDKQEAEAEMQQALSNQNIRAFRRAEIALERAVNLINVSRHRH